MVAIKLDNINKSYKENVIFKDFSIEVKEGEMVAITGESGKGKTTLLNMLGVLEAPDSGDITIQGIKNPIKSERAQIKLLRNSIGYLFQNYALMKCNSK